MASDLSHPPRMLSFGVAINDLGQAIREHERGGDGHMRLWTAPISTRIPQVEAGRTDVDGLLKHVRAENHGLRRRSHPTFWRVDMGFLHSVTLQET